MQKSLLTSQLSEIQWSLCRVKDNPSTLQARASMVSINAESLQISIRTKDVELQVLYMFKKIQKKTFSNNRFFPCRYIRSSWQEGLLKSEVFSVLVVAAFISIRLPTPSQITSPPSLCHNQFNTTLKMIKNKYHLT